MNETIIYSILVRLYRDSVVESNFTKSSTKTQRMSKKFHVRIIDELPKFSIFQKNFQTSRI